MILRKLLTIFIISTMCITPILSSLSILSSATVLSSDLNTSEVPEVHVIEDVPYIAQTEIHFCWFASFAMVFQYFGINTSIDEIIYYGGVGYSSYYPYPIEDRIICDGQTLVDPEFLGSIYGLSFDYWYTNKTKTSNEESWFEYINRVKQNVSNNIPVITYVDPHLLPAIPQQLGPIGRLMYLNKPPSRHIIVILGYNEANGTICYHDSNAGYWGDSSYGTYFWMDVKDFRKAVETAAWPYYYFEVFNKSGDPLTKEEAFEKVHKRNIEKLKGNISAYYHEYPVLYPVSFNKSEEYQLGINASIALRKDFGKGLDRRIKTICLYKLKGRFGVSYSLTEKLYHLLSILSPEDSMTLFLNPNNMLIYNWITVEKIHTAQYLWNNTDIYEVCRYDANLFDKYAENWSKLTKYYSEFMKRGILISFPCALLLINKMEETMDNIIAIEESIIEGPS